MELTEAQIVKRLKKHNIYPPEGMSSHLSTTRFCYRVGYQDALKEVGEIKKPSGPPYTYEEEKAEDSELKIQLEWDPQKRLYYRDALRGLRKSQREEE